MGVLEKYGNEYDIPVDIDGNVFYHYYVENAKAIKRHKMHLINVKGQYMRIFCHECAGSLTECMHCSNQEVRTISMDRLGTGHKLSTCYDHDEDVRPFESVNKCATCSTNGPPPCFDLYNDMYSAKEIEAKTWLKEMIECNDCKRRFC